jgi:hypothetical protein
VRLYARAGSLLKTEQIFTLGVAFGRIDDVDPHPNEDEWCPAFVPVWGVIIALGLFSVFIGVHKT